MDWLQRIEPTFNGCDDGVGVLLPDEGLRHLIVAFDEAVDRGLKVGDGAETAMFEPPLCQLGEEAPHRIEPGA